MPVQRGVHKGEKRGNYKKSSKVFPSRVAPVENEEEYKELLKSLANNRKQLARSEKAQKWEDVEALEVYMDLQRAAAATYCNRPGETESQDYQDHDHSEQPSSRHGYHG